MFTGGNRDFDSLPFHCYGVIRFAWALAAGANLIREARVDQSFNGHALSFRVRLRKLKETTLPSTNVAPVGGYPEGQFPLVSDKTPVMCVPCLFGRCAVWFGVSEASRVVLGTSSFSIPDFMDLIFFGKTC